jgi:hypothetical protein
MGITYRILKGIVLYSYLKEVQSERSDEFITVKLFTSYIRYIYSCKKVFVKHAPFLVLICRRALQFKFLHVSEEAKVCSLLKLLKS